MKFAAAVIPLVFILGACASSRTATKGGGYGERAGIRCTSPGEDVMRQFGGQINAKAIEAIVTGGGSIESKVKRIQRVSPEGANFDVVAFRLCEAVRNGLIGLKAYEKFLGMALQYPMGPKR